MPLLGQHDVGGFQIAVQKPAGMRFLKRLGDLPGRTQGIGQRQSAVLQPAMQRFPLDVFHDEEQRIAVFANLKDLADVGMIERGHGHRLAAQALARARVSRRHGWEQLDGDLAIETRIVGAIDLAHASRPDGGQNLIGAEARAGRKRQRCQTGRILARTSNSNCVKHSQLDQLRPTA